MKITEAISRIVAGQPVYRWNALIQRWTRVESIAFDRDRGGHTFAESVPYSTTTRHYSPPGKFDLLRSDYPSTSAGGIQSPYRPTPTRF
jgi:hypothetical protein